MGELQAAALIVHFGADDIESSPFQLQINPPDCNALHLLIGPTANGDISLEFGSDSTVTVAVPFVGDEDDLISVGICEVQFVVTLDGADRDFFQYVPDASGTDNGDIVLSTPSLFSDLGDSVGKLEIKSEDGTVTYAEITFGVTIDDPDCTTITLVQSGSLSEMEVTFGTG